MYQPKTTQQTTHKTIQNNAKTQATQYKTCLQYTQQQKQYENHGKPFKTIHLYIKRCNITNNDAKNIQNNKEPQKTLDRNKKQYFNNYKNHKKQNNKITTIHNHTIPFKKQIKGQSRESEGYAKGKQRESKDKEERKTIKFQLG